MLKSGDCIDIVAPSSPPYNSQWTEGLKILQSWGLRPRYARGGFSKKNSFQKQSLFLNQAFSNEDSSAVWAIRGGNGLQKLMPSFIKNYPLKKQKIFIGYSDSSAMHFFLNSQRVKTVHAPMICELSKLSKNELSSLKKLLLGQKKEWAFKLKPIKTTTEQTLKARLVGGNLTLLSTSVGTPWLRHFGPHFLFVEDVNERTDKLDRMLCHLFFSGTLKSTKAILFGHFSPLPAHSLKKVLKNFSDICPIPLIYGLSCGHARPNLPLPLGQQTYLFLQEKKAILKINL